MHIRYIDGEFQKKKKNCIVTKDNLSKNQTHTDSNYK